MHDAFCGQLMNHPGCKEHPKPTEVFMFGFCFGSCPARELRFE